MAHKNEGPETLELFGDGGQSTKQYVLGVVLAGLYGVGALIPVSGFIVTTGVVAQISFTILIAPLFGILLGPWRGFVFGLVGGVITAFLALVIPSVVLVVPTVILGPAISGFLTGLCLDSRTTQGGLITAAYLAVVVVLYLIPNSQAWWFMAPYVLAAVVALFLQVTGARFEPSNMRSLRYILPLALIGTITDFSMMTMGAVYILSLPADLFGFVIFPAMLVERTIAAVFSAAVASVVFVTFKDQLW
jgi:hypothetical protein